ncbi:glycosyltransferase family 4 protein [Arcicella rigui]|uniref:Glycosyltransferase family 4 protein n=1 Tax=Arcicella rigui TaxID=797020 RepID=A0ABU5QED3_9BACT|nr:glycosyltransferase family 4 protein [Arcicella rigui]MEA5141190.1 glycosyltransferase family 4 protein [Arcicella rigui]
MKVAYLMGSLNRGGAETLVLDICKNINEHNFEIILIHRKNGQLKEEFVQSGIELHQIHPKHIFDIAYFIKLRNIIIDNNIQIVHAHQVIDAWLAYLATLFLSKKVLLSFHGHGINGNFTANLLRKWVLTKTALNIFVSSSQKNYYEKKYKIIPKSIVLPNGIDLKKLHVQHKQSIKAELGLSDTALLIGTVGNFTSGRDHFTLCKFLYLLKQTNIEFNFLFIGAESKTEPSIYNKCFAYCQENGLGNNVFFLGTRADVPDILSQLDVFTYSTEHDTFGIAVVEAMLMGIPVFVNDWEVMLEITNEGKYAIIYKSKDEHDLLGKFNHFVDNIDTYRKVAKKNTLILKDKYSIGRHIFNLKNIYNSLLKD